MKTRETRNVNVALEKAKEWYKKGGDLKEVALQAYKKDELETPEWQNIKTFEDACKVLEIYNRYVSLHLESEERYPYYNHIEALDKLDIIRKALNGDWNPNLTCCSHCHNLVKIWLNPK